MKRGWLVVNGFLNKEKFDNIYAFLTAAADRRGVALEIKRNTDLFARDFQEGNLPDFVLFWDKDIPLARRLERAGVPLFNSPSAIEICDSKILTALCLEGKVNVPKTLIAPKTYEGIGYADNGFLQEAIAMLGLPFVIKEEFGSFGAQVYLVQSLAEARVVVEKMRYKGFVLQRFIRESMGKDVRINVVGGKVNSAMLRQNPNDFRSNITGGGKATPYLPTLEETSAAIAACEAIGLDFGGVDILFGAEGPLVCEVNSNPHFKSTYDCTGVDMSISIIDHVLEKLS